MHEPARRKSEIVKHGVYASADRRSFVFENVEKRGNIRSKNIREGIGLRQGVRLGARHVSKAECSSHIMYVFWNTLC